MSKVLIIEDRRENIVFIANNILKPLGYDVVTARDGKIGLAKALEDKPDLIITDLKLPKMGGLEVLAELRKQGISIPTIVMTFHGSETTAREALRLGARDYLIKPFTVEELHEALDRALNAPVSSGSNDSETQAKVAQLEKKLAAVQAVLVEREKQLNQMKTYVTTSLKRSQMNQASQQAEAWEKDNARLNEVLAETKERMTKAEGRASDLEEVMESQKVQMNKYRQEAMRVADELRNLSEAVRLMSQNLAHQVERLGMLTAQEEEEKL
jgi:CheY-like chemotaxis protein